MISILFIDDDSKAHRILRAVLPREYHLISTYRGAHGIEAAKREGPDLVLLDIDLPDADGIDVLKALTRLPAAPPVVMLTASDHISLVVRAMRYGAADYVVKPYELLSLTATIKNHAVSSVLSAEGCKLTYYDPYIPELPATRKYNFNMKSVNLEKIKDNFYEAAIIITDHSDVEYKQVVKKAKIVIDTRNAMKIKGLKKGKIYKA